MPNPANPRIADPYVIAQRVPLRGLAFEPGKTARHEEWTAERRWEALVDARLIGTTPPLSPERREAIDAMERALGVGAWRV